MKTVKYNYLLKRCIGLLFVLLMSCGQQENSETFDTPVSGSDTVYIEEALFPYFLKVKPIYDSVFEHAKITLIPVNARRAMALLFADSANCVILARDYLHDEDSIMKSLSLPFKQIEIAKDGLVFYVRRSLNIDTVNIIQIKDILQGMSKFSLQNIGFENAFHIASKQSSEYANVLSNFTEISQPFRAGFKFHDNRDSLKQYIRNHDAIGIGFMSDILKDSSLKPLRIGYTDTTNKRIPPQIVHPGFIVQNMYPLVVPIFAYMKNEKQNLAWGFATFMEKDPSVQKILLNEGVVPSHARYNLIRED